MAGESENRLRISPIDRLGRVIDPVVLSAAENIAERALGYADHVLRDPALAVSLLEESAATVSRVFKSRHNPHQQPIKDVRAYLFRAFIRRVNRVRRKELRFAVRYGNEPQRSPNVPRELELKILVEEIVTRCDPVVRDMFYRRVHGLSWREIGKAYGISPHAAESRFSAALARIRKRFGLAE